MVQFALARSDFRDREIKRRRAERRRGTIDLGRRALDHLGLALGVLELALAWPGRGSRSATTAHRGARWRRSIAGRRRVRRVRARCVEHPGAARGARDLVDLAGNRIQPLMNVGDVAGLRSRHRPLLGGAGGSGRAESPMVELSQSLSDMPARRAAASALSRTDGSMPSALHDTREFMLSSGSDSGAPPRHQPPRASLGRDNRIPRRAVCL